ncbi:unnamed protein product [Heligmosomoides polygyrus]|uniref:Uncharacterized protein n=1 Tax=Heligmosomoides polygyrus TaxID=6339 RepID=A0A183FAG1_HELPZ|nr:unnamed protein product [Heligmosomoides polygyrus]
MVYVCFLAQEEKEEILVFLRNYRKVKQPFNETSTIIVEKRPRCSTFQTPLHSMPTVSDFYKRIVQNYIYVYYAEEILEVGLLNFGQ